MTILPQNSRGANHPATTLEIAQTYARAGARVLPLRPKTKLPAIEQWPTKATTDMQQIVQWFGNGMQYNLGIAMGVWEHTATTGTYLVCIDLDRHEPEHDGVALWEQLAKEHGGEGNPFIADTATGGRHLVYQTPVELSNERGTLPRGIDVRGAGGQIMTEPSVHPINGLKPKWRATAKWATERPGLIPQWVLDIVQQPNLVAQTQPGMRETHLRVLDDGQQRPGDIYNTKHTWPQVLNDYGWQQVENKHDKSYWARPGKPATKDAHSAVLSHSAGAHGVLTVFSQNAPQQLLQSKFLTATGGHYKFASPFDFYTAMNHGGDHKQAARQYGAEIGNTQKTVTATGLLPGDKPQLSVVGSADNGATTDTNAPPRGHSFVLRELSELIGIPYEPRVPDRLILDNGLGVFYSDADNLVAGTSGMMKTWLQVLTCLQQIMLGKHVVIIDYEMNMRDWFTRFIALGATDTQLKLVHYCAPDEPLMQQVNAGFTGGENAAWLVMREQIARVADMPGGLAWVVIDGVTNGMTQSSLKLLDNTDIAKFWELLPKQIVKLTGAGVGLNDHVAKNTDNAMATPLGGQHKIASTSGAVHILSATSYMSRRPLNPGVVLFRCIKDRHGEVGQGRTVAQVVFTPQANGTISYKAEPYSEEHQQQRTSTKDDRVADAIRQLHDAQQKGTLNAVARMSAVDKKQLPDVLLRLTSAGQIKNYGTAQSNDWQPNTPDIDIELF